MEPYVPESSEEDGSGDQNGSATRRTLSGPELKARDEELIRLIAERKRGLVERGIKMTVVLLTSREMLENPQLEPRLSYIRRSSGLDSKASLFVLTPVARDELNDFVTSLQGALYDFAQDYYREHARRVRRKRARYPPPQSVVQPILQSVSSSTPPLSREGWQVRAEYKLATFAELGADYESAMSHYQEAYGLLAGPRGMLGSTMLLPPRTKRWAEAKVLADTFSIRIIRLFLYADDGDSAQLQFRRHLARFVELSSGWGIGDATFDFWAWLSKQYRLMGDLLDQASKTIDGSPLPPFAVSVYAPPLPGFLLHPEIANRVGDFPSLQAAPGALLTPNQAAKDAGVSPAGLVAGPGTFYYLSALCTERRIDQYKRLKALEEKGEASESATAALVHEKKLNHASMIIEAYGRAHEAFKVARQPRHSCFVAVKIASAYARNDEPKLALRFLERIIEMYRNEGWMEAYSQLLLLALDCAKLADELESHLQLLIEGLALVAVLSSDQRQSLVEHWKSYAELNQSAIAEDKAPLSLRFEHRHAPLNLTFAFNNASIPFGASASFQLTVQSQQEAGVDLSFETLELLDDSGVVVGTVAHQAGAGDLQNVGSVGGTETSSADLHWQAGQTRTFEGRLDPTSTSLLKVASIRLSAKVPRPVDLQLDLPSQDDGLSLPEAPLWRTSKGWLHLSYRDDPTACRIQRPSHQLDVEVLHHPIGYLDEAVALTVKICNKDREPLDCSADVVLQPLYQGSQDELALKGPTQPTLSGSLKGLQVGSLPPGQTGSVSFLLRSRHRTGPRHLTIFVQSTPERNDATTVDLSCETIHDITIPVHRAFRAEYGAQWKANEVGATGQGQAGHNGRLEDPLKSPSHGPDRAIAELHAAFGVLTTETLTIKDVSVSLDEGEDAQVVEANQDLKSATLEGEWKEGDRCGYSWTVEMGLKAYESENGPRGPTGNLLITWKRAEDELNAASNSFFHITRLPLPILASPHLNARVLVASPPVTHALQPFTLVFVVVNPSPHLVDISVFLDDDPSWVIGHRTLSIPGIPPRGSRSVPTRIVPRKEGMWTLPRVRAFQQRSKEELEMGLLINETQYGLPLQVRFRAR